MSGAILDRKYAQRQDWDSELLSSDDIEQPDDNHEDEKQWKMWRMEHILIIMLKTM